MAELPEYAFFVSDDTVYAGLYMACKTHISLKNGAQFDLVEKTDYPWNGKISFSVENWNGVPFRMMARVPGWAGGGFKELDTSKPEIEFDMTPQMLRANPKLEENENSVCIRRGPIVYCMEAEDASGWLMPQDSVFEEYVKDIEGEKVIALKTSALKLDSVCSGLYERIPKVTITKQPLELIPYFAWDNSGFQEMRIWIPVRY